MTLRASGKEVKEIITTGITVDTIEANHLVTASTVVDDHLASSSLSVTALKAIELYLGAHFVALTEEKGGLTAEGMDEVTSKMFGKFEAGFGATRYGQQALMFDTTGVLRSLTAPTLKAQFRVV